jgi:hypothetical protein
LERNRREFRPRACVLVPHFLEKIDQWEGFSWIGSSNVGLITGVRWTRNYRALAADWTGSIFAWFGENHEDDKVDEGIREGAIAGYRRDPV